MTGPRVFDRLVDDIIVEVARDMFAIAEVVAVEAQISISAGSVSGKNHVPSNPGEPPQNDTGVLAGGIEVRMDGPLRAHVVSTAKYGRALEYGTSKMAARPFMRPAAEATRAEVRKRVRLAVKRAIRRAKRT